MTRTLARSVLLAVLLAASVLQAQTGNIDPSQRHAWAESAGWLDFRPVFGGVTVLPTYLTGYAWSEAVGWVKLGADGSGPYVNDGTPGTWCVNLNSVTGVLSGFAWSESAGWIRMDPAFGGVTYNGLTHQMSGWAWSESHGWIHFRSTTPTAYGVAVTCGSLTGTVTGGGTICTGASSTVTVTVSGGAAPYSVTLDNGGGTQSGAGPAFTFTVTPASTTTYSVASLTDGLSCVGAGSGSATVTVNSTPVTPTASSNSPVCTGSTINLSTPTVAGATYAWTGPNGYTSSAQNPTIPNATAAMAGTYSVTVTGSGCVSGAGTTAVVVNATPATPTAGNGGAICAGGTISLTASTVAGATYAWTGPNGYTSSAQNPTIPSATVAMAGIYSVTATVNGCASPASTTSVTVNPIPSTPTAGNGGAVCAGGTISLTASTVAGATYAWTGPNGYTSSAQNPTIPNATVAMAGTYSVTATVSGCTSPAGTTVVTVNSAPAPPAASSNSPVCTGSAINLSTPTVAGATYAWTGPNGFSSASQNPTIPNATAAMAGTYSVTVTGSGCVSGAGTTNVVVNATPATPTAGNGGAICAGGTISLTASTVAGATYAWTGPNGYTSSAQNPTIPSATVAMSGTYSVKAIVNGCASDAGTTTVVVDASPATPVLTAPLNVWPEQSFKVSVPAVAGVTYDWIVTNGTITAGSGTREITITAGTTGSVEVSVSETDEVSGCFSADGCVTMPIAFLATGYYVFAPCRLFDTRFSSGDAAASPALSPGETRILAIGTRCGIPTSTVRSLAVNQTVTTPSADGEIVLFRGDLSATPITSSLSYRAGRTRANNAILELSWSGDGTIKVHNRSAGSVHFILDVTGAFQ